MENCIDAIYCIGLENHDRTQTTINHLQDHGIRVELFPAIMKKNHIDGCWLSHRTLWTHGQKMGYTRILIFENDVRIRRPIDWGEIHDIIQNYPNFNVLYLGHSPLKTKKIEDNLSLVHSLYTHAYIINLENDQWLNRILQYSFYNYFLPIDALFMVQDNMYAIHPMIAFQQDGSQEDTPSNLGDWYYNICNVRYNYAPSNVMIILLIVLLLILIIAIIIHVQ